MQAAHRSSACKYARATQRAGIWIGIRVEVEVDGGRDGCWWIMDGGGMRRDEGGRSKMVLQAKTTNVGASRLSFLDTGHWTLDSGLWSLELALALHYFKA